MAAHRWFPILAGAVFVGGHLWIFYGCHEYFQRVMPAWDAITPTDDASLTSGNGNVRDVFGKYLVDADKPKNKSWWNWSYRDLQNSLPILNGTFAKVALGYSQNDDRALNRKCASLYEKRARSLSEDEKQFLWGYCSVGRQELITLDKYKNDNYHMINLVLGGDCKSRLVSTRHHSNIWWWAIRKKEFINHALTSHHYSAEDSIMLTCDVFYFGHKHILDKKEEIIKICGIIY